MNRIVYSLVLAGLALLLLKADPVVAQTQEFRWTHFGPRALAMGNAFTAVADDHNALFYNPAGLARRDDWQVEIFNPRLAVSQDGKDFVSDIVKIATGSMDLSSTTEAIGFVEGKVGTTNHFSLGMTPFFVMKNFGIGIGAELNASLEFHRFPSIYVDAGPRVMMPISYARNFFEDRLSVGVSVKPVFFTGVQREFSIQELTNLTSDSGSSSFDDYFIGGTGLGADVGFLFTPVETMKPTFGFTVMDIGGTPYKAMDMGSGGELTAPDIRLPTVNTGFSLVPWQQSGMYLMTTADVQGINRPMSFSKKLHLGVEWGLGKIFKVSAGLKQGYLTGGFQLDMWLLKVRMATYAEELGTVAGSIEDRRYMLEMKILL